MQHTVSARSANSAPALGRSILCFAALVTTCFGLAWSVSHFIKHGSRWTTLPMHGAGFRMLYMTKMILVAESVTPDMEQQYPGLRQQIVSQRRLAGLLEGKSVALVGNGNNLMDSGTGTQIDSHDLVMRINHFPPPLNPHPILGDDIGYKFDVIAGAASAAGIGWAFDTVNSTRKHLLLNSSQVGITLLLDCCDKDFGLKFIHDNKIMNATTHSPGWFGVWTQDRQDPLNSPHPDFASRAAAPTTGYLCALFLRTLIEHDSIKDVTLYGFGGTGHTYDANSLVKNHIWHAYDLEHKQFAQWEHASKGRFRVFTPPAA